MKIAVLGGSFNPIHKGHLYLAEQVKNLMGYEKILFIPTYISPFKQRPLEVSDTERLILLKKALASQKAFGIETFEMKKKGLSYTYDTIIYLNKKYKKALAKESEEKFQKIALIMGLDLLEDFHKWHKYEALAEKVHFIIAKRSLSPETSNKSTITKEEAEKKALNSFPFSYELLDNEYIGISSSEIREKIQAGNDWQAYLPKKVAAYINKKGLYAKH